ncbi:hypothetical protein JOF53_005634 [Crossiella equi]|uniref:Uncharacterized protein n=2 Tax=Crossiella equi TaxID=130796 RepID=A0ABS5AKI2_9PSEU|nr:PPE domain-containing protein [Crossiella equi]MBP2476762.1 hypothetical protein [Crossiella equi]
MINEGRGHYSLSSRGLLWEYQAKRLDDIGNNVRKAFEAAAGVTQGRSFDQMQERVSPAYQWAEQASTMAGQVRSVAETSTGTFTDTKSKIGPPVQVTETDNAISRGWAWLTDGMTDKQAQQAQADDAQTKARETMRTYERTVLSSTSNLPVFTAPDPIDVGVGTGGGGTTQVGTNTTTTNTRQHRPGGSDNQRPGFADRDGDGIPDDRDPRDDRNVPDRDGDGIPDDRDPVDNRNPGRDQVDPNLVVTPPVQPTPPPNLGIPVGGGPGVPGGGPMSGPGFVGGMGGFGPSGSGAAMRPGFGPSGMAGVGAGGAAAANGGGFGPGGRGGAPGMGGPMGSGARAGGEEDKEHKRPDYLIEIDDIFGDGTLVAPPVIGER